MEELTERALRSDYLMDRTDPHSIKRALVSILVHEVGKDPLTATDRDWYYALAYLLRGMLSERAIKTDRAQESADTRRVYYLSMEYLIGRTMEKVLHDLGVREEVRTVLHSIGHELEAVEGHESDAALGNGGLGRLAACFLDSMATHAYPGWGYGLRYQFGMFNQRIEDGQQKEHPEHWLRYGNPWEFERPSVVYPVRFHGHILCFNDEKGEKVCRWVDAEEVVAVAYDVPISGYHAESTSNLRLWQARATRDFDLDIFNEGNYMDAVRLKTTSESLSKVLYPNDSTVSGQELRLKQEYFFVSASLQDILAHFLQRGGNELRANIALC